MRKSSTTTRLFGMPVVPPVSDRKSTRLNSSHLGISYAVFCLKKKNATPPATTSESSIARSASVRDAGLASRQRRRSSPVGRRIVSVSSLSRRTWWLLWSASPTRRLSSAQPRRSSPVVSLFVRCRSVPRRTSSVLCSAAPPCNDSRGSPISKYSPHQRRAVIFFFYHPSTTEIYTLSLHDALPI